jgi:cytochrome o ubiquinol oxidase subunit 2
MPSAYRFERPSMQTMTTPSVPDGRPAFPLRAARIAMLALVGSLSGCSMDLLDPQGAIGVQEKTLILVALGLMLLVVVPVIALTLWFGWKYRASNARAVYAPTWAHSTRIEVVVWTVPCVIVAILGVLIWRTTDALDPYRPIMANVKPVRVQVVALNWKWLFVYPDYGVATVNELAIPVGTPIDFELTAESLMNSFFIPRLGSQVYAMAGMRTQLHLIADAPGTYRGQSAAFSGEGFSDMHFDAVAMSSADFAAWMRTAQQSPQVMDALQYRSVSLPATHVAPTVYAGVEPDLFDGIVDRFSRQPGSTDICTTPAIAQATVSPRKE